MTTQFRDIPEMASPRWKSPVASSAALPATGNTAGDARVTLDTQGVYIWSGSAWTAVSGGGGGSPGGSSGAIQYNGGGTFAGDDNTSLDGSGNLVVRSVSSFGSINKGEGDYLTSPVLVLQTTDPAGSGGDFVSMAFSFNGGGSSFSSLSGINAGADGSIQFMSIGSPVLSISPSGTATAVITYAPSNPSDWSGSAPTTIAEALDRIAAVIIPKP